MHEQFDLSGRVALVTGSARGLGFEIARGFAKAGATVFLNGTSAERLAGAVERLAAEGLGATPLCFDVSDEAAAAEAVARIALATGRFDILVNNVGVRMREPLERIGAAELRRMLDVDLVASFALARVAAPHMARGGYGRIINISSTIAMRGRKGDAAYIIAKGGVNAMSIALANELGTAGITCNAIMPGAFLTETNQHLTQPEMVEKYSRLPVGRVGQPPEIAGPAVFLASPAAGYVTGVCLPVDGGALAAAF